MPCFKFKKSSRSNKKGTSGGSDISKNEEEPNVSAKKVEQNLDEGKMKKRGRSSVSADEHRIKEGENNPALEMGKVELSEDETVASGGKVEAVDGGDGGAHSNGQKVEL